MTFEEVIEKGIAFREERDWTQFHNPKRSRNIDQSRGGRITGGLSVVWTGCDGRIKDRKGKGRAG